jgi:hypothetical protein
MTQQELERELAQLTGESITTIRNRGFSLIEPPDVGPATIDWDTVYPTEPLRGRRTLRRRARQAA